MGDRLKSKIAIVTGAGSGIGRAIAEGYAAEGARVVAADVAPGPLKDVCDAINRRYKDAALPVTCDVADKASVDAMVKKAVDTFGRVDILLHSAALWKNLEHRPFYEIPVEEWDKVFAINTRGSFLCGAAVAPVMQKQKSGRIIFIGSGTIWTAQTIYVHYVASKSALIGLMRCMARELGPSFVNVNLVHPGFTDTGGIPRDVIEKRSKQVRLIPNVQEAADLVGVALFLASDESASVTGQQIQVSGGAVLT